MRREFAGAVSLRGGAPPVGEAALRAALDGAPGGSATTGSAAAAWTGPGVAVRAGGLCLLDGRLDGAEPTAVTPGMASSLDGDFALFAWSAARRAGVLARDHLGARALFWTVRGDSLLFATELEPLIRLLPARPPPDRVALPAWLASEPLPGDRTLYEGVRRLLPAHELLVSAGAAPVPRPYWTPRYEPPQGQDRDGLVEHLREQVSGLARRAVAGPSPTGVFVSGGLDSASLAAFAVEESAADVRGYSASFPGFPDLDETELVRGLARAAGMPLTQLVVGDRGLLAGGLAHISRWGVPPVGWADFWEQPLLARASEEGVTRMVSGDGGDEVFGLRPHLLADLLRGGHVLAARRLLHRAPGAAAAPDAAVRDFFTEFAIRGAAPYRLHRLARRRPGRGGRFWLNGPSNALLREHVDRWDWKGLDGPLWWRSIADLLCRRVDARGVLDHMRRRVDWAGMDGRHPFMDRRAVELALRIPPELTFDPVLDRRLLREAVAGRVPDEIRLRARKARFDAMVIANLRRDLVPLARLVCAPDAEVRAFVDPDALARLVEGSPGAREGGPFVWAQEVLRLVTTEAWLRQQGEPGFADRLLEERCFSQARIQPLKAEVQAA